MISELLTASRRAVPGTPGTHRREYVSQSFVYVGVGGTVANPKPMELGFGLERSMGCFQADEISKAILGRSSRLYEG